MSTNLTIMLGVALALAGTALAYGPQSREVISPGTFFHPVTGGAGLVTCDVLTSPDPGSFCGTQFTDIGCSNDDLPAAVPSLLRGNGVADNVNGCLDDIDGSAACVATDNGNDCDGKEDVANGSCNVSTGTTTVSPGGPAWFFVCGADRDDDTIVTDGDATGTSSDTHDDDFVTGNGPGPNVPFCFARDRITLGPTDPNAAGDDWDDFVVFVGVNFGNLPAGTIGTLVVTLSANGGNGPCTGARSSHATSNDWVA